MKGKNVGFAITGSFCTLKRALVTMKDIKSEDNNVIPIISHAVAQTNTKYYDADDFRSEVANICGNDVVFTMTGAEPVGPTGILDILIIAPCTGNTLGKLNNAVSDTPVLMAAKAHLRNGKPVLIAVSTNDGLAGNFKNIGELLNKKNIYFVPFEQDDCIKKPYSIISDFNLLIDAADAALMSKQLQPVLKRDIE
ncbi:MAG: dipicolinate synthase subunit B [Christensenellaceae bacterium]|jgi:dipicolinate synthase subunit B|nr:dipicolinate synthase subunit B [Christensenellaceae bacterium]